MIRLELSAPVKWSTIATVKTLTAKGASLKFIPPMVKECMKYAQLDKSEVDSLSEVQATAIILYVVGKTSSIGALTKFIEQSWNSAAKPIIYLCEKGCFSCEICQY